MKIPKLLTSYQNVHVKKIRTILENPRDYPTSCIVEGLRACEVFCSSPVYSLEQWFITPTHYDTLPSFIDKNFLTLVSPDVMKTMSRATTPSGILGHFIQKPLKDIDYDHPTFVLCKVSDPGNVGTIIRTAAALGRKSIIMIGGCYHHSYKVVQASAGMLAHIKIIRCSWTTFCERKNPSIPFFGLDASGISIQTFNDNELKTCYIGVGNEANGIPPEILASCNKTIAIPMEALCESLNASVAASIIGYRAWGKR